MKLSLDFDDDQLKMIEHYLRVIYGNHVELSTLIKIAISKDVAQGIIEEFNEKQRESKLDEFNAMADKFIEMFPNVMNKIKSKVK
jgi:uncharacterized protein YbjQ (UPF0145 family)